MDAADIDHNFEPQTRARSNTWPLRPNRELEPQSSPTSEDSNPEGQKGCEKDPLGLNTKKSGSRRNAWGNLSYADLITKAIQSSPEKRLTLSQIYDWMVQNVPYFKDKGDSTSSAGWKVSVIDFYVTLYVYGLMLLVSRCVLLLSRSLSPLPTTYSYKSGACHAAWLTLFSVSPSFRHRPKFYCLMADFYSHPRSE